MVAWGRGRVNKGRPRCSVGSERIAPRGSTALMASVAWAIIDPARRPVILLLLALHVYAIGSHLVVHFEPRFVLPSMFALLVGLGYMLAARASGKAMPCCRHHSKICRALPTSANFSKTIRIACCTR